MTYISEAIQIINGATEAISSEYEYGEHATLKIIAYKFIHSY
jgi:hypothetical protein